MAKETMVPMSKIQKGVAAYLDAELMPKLDRSGWEKVLIGTAASLAISRAGAIAEGYKNSKVVKMLGIVDDAGNVDVHAIAEEMKKNIGKEGFTVEVPILGALTFHKDDVDKLYGFIAEV